MHHSPETLFPVLDAFAQQEMHSLLEKSYGSRFKSDVVTSAMSRATKFINLRDEDNLVATSSLEGNRIALFGTSDFYGKAKRGILDIELMSALHNDSDAEWVSIDQKHRMMHIGAAAVGMRRVQDMVYAEALISDPLRDGHYTLTKDDDNGLLLVSGASLAQPGYVQQIWAWENNKHQSKRAS